MLWKRYSEAPDWYSCFSFELPNLPTKALGLYVLLVALVCVFIYLFLFCIFISYTVCGCIFRLLVPLQIVSLALKHTYTHMWHTQALLQAHTNTHTVTENRLHVASDEWVYRDEIGRAECYPNTDQWRASYCPGLDLLVVRVTGLPPSSLLPAPLALLRTACSGVERGGQYC